ncbi:MAG: hypothetical protein ACYSWO_28980 [Planctomycetota bacterium]
MADKLIVALPGITMVLYALTGLAFVSKKDPAWAIVYFAYALANVGLIFASTQK